MNCQSGSGAARTGEVMIVKINMSKALVHSEVQVNLVSFFNRFVSGHAMSAKPSMNSR